jgi:hypothetical protein
MNQPAVLTKKRSPWPLVAMIGVFAAPILAAWFFYLNPQYLPGARSNKGELLQPMLALNVESGLLTANGADFDLDALAGKWTLVSLQRAPCADECRRRLVDLRQIRLALGESRYSVERLLILTDPTDTARLMEDFDGLQIATLSGAGKAWLVEKLGEGDAALNRLYILDPLGNLMMRYPSEAPAKDPLKDMERLLKASKNWIKGANYGHR